MQILVDADACPKVIKDILFRAAERRQMQLTLVANKLLYCPPSQYIRALQVPAGFDVADNKIAELVGPGDLVITADIPLAAEVIARGGHALNPRGEFYTRDTIQERLTMRDFMDNLRGSGVDTGGPPALNQRDRQEFANQLDRFLAKHPQVARAG
ncbi:MAG: YaiI/YqxD family protein [Nitrosomonadales bacterium]|nr:YaiI/YqxD family protein [Nitrosomonadales bacterium]